jgi:hypothetical protein
MEYAIIGITALGASLLTFFSGFGLGTLLTPVFAVFFPLEVAVALTGIVHFLNNLFKIALIGKHINWNIGMAFGAMAMVGAFGGAWILTQLATDDVLYTYHLNGKLFEITTIKLVIAALMVVFVLFDIVPGLKKIQFGKQALVPGGVISGFFGGLSGHQGALRSMFLIRFGMTKEAFVATGILIACAVDVTRLGVYYARMDDIDIEGNLPILLTAVLSAFAGAYFGRMMLKKVTLNFVQNMVSVLLVLMALAIGAGVI